MSLLSGFVPRSAENRAAIRTSFAAVAAMLLAFKLHLATPYWSGMTVVILSNLYTGNIIDKAMMRILGTIAGAFTGFFLAGLVINSLLLYLFASFSAIALAVYYYHFSRYAYAWLLFGLTILIIISQLAMNAGNAFYVAIWRSVEIGLGVVVASLTAYSIFPNPVKDLLGIRFESLFNDLSVILDTYSQNLQSASPEIKPISELNLQLKKDCRDTMELIGALRREPRIKKEDIDHYRAILDTIYQFTRLLQYQIHSGLKVVHLTGLHRDKLFSAIEADLVFVKQAFKGQKVLVNESLQTVKAVEEFEQQIRSMQNRPEELQAIYAFNHFVGEIQRLLENLSGWIKGAGAEQKSPSIYRNAQRRLRNDPDLIKHSIKAGLTVLLALGFWFISNWPGGLNGIISSILISVRRNIYEMKNIGLYRLLGCFAGGSIALSALALLRMNLYDFILIIFVFVWGFSYFSFKYPTYAYLGLQANLALIITLAQEGGPPLYLHPPLERLAGVVMGITASIIVANLVWRSDPLSMLERYITKLSRYMKDNLQQVLFIERESVRLHDLTNLFWISRGLIENMSSESLSEDKFKQLQSIKNQFETDVFIQATISHIFSTMELNKIRISARAYQPSLSDLEKNLMRYYQGEGVKQKELIQSMQDLLQAIKDSPPEDEECFKGLMVYLDSLIQLARRHLDALPLMPLNENALTPGMMKG